MSLIDICNAVAAIPVSFDVDGVNYTINGTPLQDIVSSVPPAVTPTRLILPPGVYGQGSNNFRYVTQTVVHITWNIVDLLLYEAAPIGTTIGTKYTVMAAYISRYVESITSIRKLTGNSMISGVNPVIGIIEYPRGSKRYFNGVQMVISVDENIC